MSAPSPWQALLTDLPGLARLGTAIASGQQTSPVVFPPVAQSGGSTLATGVASAQTWWGSLSTFGKVAVGGLAVFLLMLGSGGRR